MERVPEDHNYSRRVVVLYGWVTLIFAGSMDTIKDAVGRGMAHE